MSIKKLIFFSWWKGNDGILGACEPKEKYKKKYKFTVENSTTALTVALTPT
jgi:hypothetical protein